MLLTAYRRFLLLDEVLRNVALQIAHAMSGFQEEDHMDGEIEEDDFGIGIGCDVKTRLPELGKEAFYVTFVYKWRKACTECLLSRRKINQRGYMKICYEVFPHHALAI